MPYLTVIIALVVLVVFHELGHFLAARFVGIRATKFYVFFPPALFKKEINGVEYGIGAIPLGGFVKLPGMFKPEPLQIAERARWEIDQLSDLTPEQKLEADALHRRLLRSNTADELREPLKELSELVEQHSQDLTQNKGSASADYRATNKSLTRLVDLTDEVHEKAYWRAPLWRRMSVIFAGPAVNIVIAFFVLTCFYWGFVPKYETQAPLRVESVAKDSPAAAAGLTEDSLIHAWNGPVVGVEPGKLLIRIKDSLGKPVELTFSEPGKAKQTKRITPTKYGDEVNPRIGVMLPANDSDKALKVGIVGRQTTSVKTGTKAALEEMRYITWGNLTRLPRVFFDKEVRSEVGSVVGIVQVAQEVDRAGQIIRYVGIISLILAVMNLLPLLPLDGGHLLFGLFEKLRRGNPLPKAAFERYSMFGLALVLVLFMIGLDNDITRARG